ncbi:hypothetical protein [Mesorhizobium sp. L103C119B0]|uniref:hypothetical protein n=1 Tax=Mesorhizobium sp. L103C119B0 TaxID=1287085 RepID=UPI0012DE4A18|nr:hypothetical protein [Mesorhizobium sp. L103C119B0]
MAIYEKEFYRRRLSWGNHVSWSLRYDCEAGTLRVRTARTSKSAYIYDRDMEPSDFVKSGNWYQHRVFKREMESFFAGIGMKEISA